MFPPTLPALAAAIAVWFPDLQGRSIAIAAPLNFIPENPPSLPLCTVALDQEKVQKGSAQRQPRMDDEIVVEFWFPPERYKRQDNTESPFFTFYDYETLRDQLLTNALDWLSPRGLRLVYVGCLPAVTNYAAIISFKFIHSFQFCPLDEDDCAPDDITNGDGLPFRIQTTRALYSDFTCPDPIIEPGSDCPDAMADHVQGAVEPKD